MAMNRMTYFFRDSNGYGWSENIHSTINDLETLLVRAKDLLPFRTACLGNTANLVYIRVSDDLVYRDSQVYLVPLGDQTVRGSAAGGADPANTSLVVRMTATSLHRRTLYMRGIPDACVTASGKYTPTPDFAVSLASWIGEVIDGNFALKSRTRLVIPVAVSATNQAVPSGLVTVTTAVSHGLFGGDGVVISRVGGSTQINGTWAVISVPSPTTFTIQLQNLMSPYTAGGTVQKIGYVLNEFTNITAERISKRAAGRPFDSPRGRRSRVRAR